MLKGFRELLLRGSLIDLAIAVVIGTAFAVVVNSLVGSIVMPSAGAIFGKPNPSALTFTIHNSIFSYGRFVADPLTFGLVAAVLFFFVVMPAAALLTPFAKERADESDVTQDLLTDIKRRLEEHNGLLRT